MSFICRYLALRRGDDFTPGYNRWEAFRIAWRCQRGVRRELAELLVEGS